MEVARQGPVRTQQKGAHRERDDDRERRRGDKLVETVSMSDANRLRYLRVVLVVVGLIFVFGIYTLAVVWPSGWAWGHGHSHYLMMILGVYAMLGVFLLIASKNPAAHTSLIWSRSGRASCTPSLWPSRP
jgi:hypothetical protein